MMRDLGYDFLWSDKYAENILAKGFEYVNQDIKLVTAFELMEHIEDPCTEIEKILRYSDNIVFSTLCYDEGYNYKDSSWWYYGQEDGQHIMFYSRQTLKYIAKLYDLNYYDAGVLHIFTKKELSALKLRLLFHSKLMMPMMCLDWLWMMWKNKATVVKDRENILLSK